MPAHLPDAGSSDGSSADRPGAGVLVRVAGLPVRLWLAGAAPDLFALLDDLDRAQIRYAELAGRLADRIGAEVIGAAGLPAERRRRALSLRRMLHNGVPLPVREREHLVDLAAHRPIDAALADLLVEVAGLAGRVADLDRRATESVATEHLRLLSLPWHLLNADPVGARILADSASPVADVPHRLASGEPWTTKRMRRRSAYLWRMIARGAVKTTPRGWLGHVAVVPVVESDDPALVLPVLTRVYATESMANLHGPRLALATSGELTGDTIVTIAPLRQRVGDRLRIWSFDPDRPSGVGEVSVRATPHLATVDSAMAGDARTVAQITALVLPADAPASASDLLRRFLGHLATLGIVQASIPPHKRYTGWSSLDDPVGPLVPSPGGDRGRGRVGAPASVAEGGYVDVYRTADGGVSAAAAEAFEASVRLALRIHGLIRLDRPERPPAFLQRLGAAPRPVLDVLATRLNELAAAPALPALAGGGSNHGHFFDAGWGPAHTAGSGYDRLLRWIDGQAGQVGDPTPIRVTAGLLDLLGAPAVEPSWPLDCTVRPVASGQRAVLNMLLPAGRLDARFAEAIGALRGPAPGVGPYRDFLTHLDELTRTTSVELLIPPLGDLAANAVRRPAYTGAWTGDCDLATYSPIEPARRQRFLPLSELTVRRVGDGVVVEAAGAAVRVLHHSMRRAPRPWNLVQRLLTRTTEPERWNLPRLRCPLLALPGRDYLPRLEVSDHLVLSPAQWRLTATDLWSATASDVDKARHLRRLRDRLGLPRWVVVRSGSFGTPFPCDLASVIAIDVLERPFTGARADPEPTVLVEEMMPIPDEMPRLDRSGDRYAAEVMIRVPGALRPADLAAVAAAAEAAARRPPTANGGEAARP